MPRLTTDALVDAIGQVESGGNPAAVGDAGAAVGAYQMQAPAYADVQRLYPQEFGRVPFAALRTNPVLQRRAATRYLHALEDHYGVRDLDRLIAGYNAGPRVRHGVLPNPDYVRKVRGVLAHPPPPMTRFTGGR